MHFPVDRQQPSRVGDQLYILQKNPHKLSNILSTRVVLEVSYMSITEKCKGAMVCEYIDTWVATIYIKSISYFKSIN